MRVRLSIITGVALLGLTGGLFATKDALPARAAFPGTNGKIAFQSDRDCGCPGDVYDIFVMDADGTGPMNLTNSPTLDDESPSWSPDGGRIAFTSTRNGNADVYVMNADGSGEVRLTTDPAADGTPAWSPDGLKIAFDSFRDGNSEIYVMNADGTAQQNLSNSSGCDQFPAWSPDGSKIAFQSDRHGPLHACSGMESLSSDNEIYVMNADGSSQTRLTFNSAFDGHRATWSPDGMKIAFSSTRDHTTGDIFVMEADGTSQINVTNFTQGAAYPAWSPDGAKITYESETPAGTREVFLMNADGSGQVDLSNHAAKDYLPDWQRLGGDTDGDGMLDDYENAHPCLNPNVADASADPDADLLTNIDEYTGGTDPCDPDSDRDSSKPEYVNVHGDGCADGRELLLVPLTDPLNPWDFYSVPAPALLAIPSDPPPGPIGVVRDNVVTATDAQAVFAYYKAGAKAGTPVYEQDLNKNRVKDGIEYDRSLAGPGMSGPPNGVVEARDAQIAFAQYKLNYKC